MAAVGSSVGLGNLWRFSAELGTNGGAAFLTIYVACILFVGIPVLMAEYIIGRAGRASSAVGSSDDLADRSGVSRIWSSGAWFGMIASFLIVSFYCVVAAWVLAYIPKFLFGGFSGMDPDTIAKQFGIMISGDEATGKGGPLSVLPYFLFFGLLTTWLVARGVNKGIEFAAKLLMPLFFMLLAGLALYSILSSIESGGTGEALAFMFTPDFSKITPGVAQSALGQACFSIGIGNAIMITYGSYLPRSVSIPKSSVLVSVVDTCVAIIAGLAITSSVSLLEPSVAWVAEKTGWTKRKAAWITGAAIMTLGLGSLFSSDFFEFIDTGLAGPILAPLSGLLVVLFTGWRLKKSILTEELAGEGEALGRFILIFVRYVAPVFMGLILILGTWERWIAPLFGG